MEKLAQVQRQVELEKTNLRDVQAVFEQQKLLLADLNNLDTSAAVPKPMKVLSEPKREQSKEKDGQSYQDCTKLKGRRPREEEYIPKTQNDPSRLGKRYAPSPG